MDIGVWSLRGEVPAGEVTGESLVYKWYRMKVKGLEEVIFKVNVDREGRRL